MFPKLSNSLKSFLEKNNVSCKIIDVNAHAYATKGKKYLQYWHLKNGYHYTSEHETMLKFYRDYRTLMLYYMDEIKKMKTIGFLTRFVGIIVKILRKNEEFWGNLKILGGLGGGGVGGFF